MTLDSRQRGSAGMTIPPESDFTSPDLLFLLFGINNCSLILARLLVAEQAFRSPPCVALVVSHNILLCNATLRPNTHTHLSHERICFVFTEYQPNTAPELLFGWYSANTGQIHGLFGWYLAGIYLKYRAKFQGSTQRESA